MDFRGSNLKVVAAAVSLVVLSACSQDFGIKTTKLPTFCTQPDGSVVPGDCGSAGGGGSSNGSNTSVSVNSTPTPPPPPTTTTNTTGITYHLAQEQIPISSLLQKKIDLILVVDNSGSMGSEQGKVASGLQSAAQTYFNMPGIDVCVWAVSSSRYVSSSGQEVNLGCANSSNSSAVSSLINLIGPTITGFGTGGNGNECLGKALVTFLTGASSFSGVSASASGVSLRSDAGFRSEATKAIVFATDENNYFGYSYVSGTGGGAYENYLSSVSAGNAIWATAASSGVAIGDWDFAKNDIPVKSGVLRRQNALAGAALVPDTRTGIMNYLDSMINFTKLTTLSFLKLQAGQPAPLTVDANGPNMGAKNLFPLAAEVGNGSLNADIDGADYAAQFQSLFQNSISIASQIQLARTPFEITSVALIRGGVVTQLGSNLYVVTGNRIQLNTTQSPLDSIQAGDEIRVDYKY